jgi:phytoene dehydrogenase-like protein
MEHRLPAGTQKALTRRLRREMDDTGVTVVLDTEVTKALVEKCHPDTVIIATGATPTNLPVRGANRKTVVQANDVIRLDLDEHKVSSQLYQVQ